jgi:hypothetical protein
MGLNKKASRISGGFFVSNAFLPHVHDERSCDDIPAFCSYDDSKFCVQAHDEQLPGAEPGDVLLLPHDVGAAGYQYVHLLLLVHLLPGKYRLILLLLLLILKFSYSFYINSFNIAVHVIKTIAMPAGLTVMYLVVLCRGYVPVRIRTIGSYGL